MVVLYAIADGIMNKRVEVNGRDGESNAMVIGVAEL